MWGSNDSTKLGFNNSVKLVKTPKKRSLKSASPINLIAAGKSHSIAVTEDGKLYSWGSRAWGNNLLLPLLLC